MEKHLQLQILAQPNLVTCGPTCLQSVYNYYNDDITLKQVIDEVEQFKDGGTLAVLLACHALKRGYKATIYSYNLRVFDPTWFKSPDTDLKAKLHAMLHHWKKPKLRTAVHSYLKFLELGGVVRFEDLTKSLIRRFLKQGKPILTGLSSTYLYRAMREYGEKMDDDDVRGEPSGHFVVLCGYDKEKRNVLVADPFVPNPMNNDQYYAVDSDRLICSILLGVLTYDANLLIIEPKHRKAV